MLKTPIKFDSNNDLNAEIYDELPLWAAPFGMMLLDKVPYKNNQTVLDIGAGCGFPSIDLAMRLGNTCSIYAVDPWTSGINRIKKKLDFYQVSNYNIIEALAENLPFEDNHFDLVISNNGLNNVEDLQKSLSEIFRVMKSDANLIFTTNGNQTFDSFYEIFKEYAKEKNRSDVFIKILNHIDNKRKPAKEISELLEKIGFKLNEIDYSSVVWKFNDGISFFNHYFINYYFLPSWKEIIPADEFDNWIVEIAARLDNFKEDALKMKIPILCFSATK